MKQLALTLIAILSLCGRMAAQQVSVADIEALPGETLFFTIQLDTQGGSYVGLEFDVQFPQADFATTGNATTLADWNGAFTIGGVGAVGISNLARCGVLSYSNAPIPGEGLTTLGQVEFTIADDISLGNYVVTLTNMTLVGDVRVPVADATFNVSVVSVHDVLLDENATTAPKRVSPANVRVKRTINAGEWSTLVLPFDMTAAQVYEAFGDDVELQEFIDYEANDDLTQITINFEPALIAEDGLMANYPYVIRTSRDITEFTVDGVTIDPDEEGAVAEYTNGRTGSRKVVYAYFQGTYKAGTVIPADNLFLSDNQFWYSVGMTQTKAYRAYFWLQDMLASASDGASSRIILNVGNGGVATGITSHESQAVGGSEVYDLQGRRVDIPSRKGLYIRDGKKVVINN